MRLKHILPDTETLAVKRAVAVVCKMACTGNVFLSN
jgi:hypothetical protein